MGKSAAEQAAQSDPELIKACIDGSDDAWRTLVDRYTPLVASIPARSGLPPDRRDDVFQSVWAITVRHLGAVRDHRSFPAWLIRTTQRETWRVAREAKKGGTGFREREPAWADPDEAALFESRQSMREALDSMDERCRALLLTLFREDRPDYDRIGEELGIPRGSIGPTRGRCLDKLRALYASAATGPGEDQ